MANIITKFAKGGVELEVIGGGSLPDGGETGQLLRKTDSGAEWGDETKELPEGGTAGQVLTKTETGTEWGDETKELPEGGTAGQVLKKTANGTEWGDETKELPELGENGQVLTVSLGERDTQGPAPDGYHVPTKDEWQAVYDAGVSLGLWSSSNGDDMRIKLKIPFAGYRYYTSSKVGSQGSHARYWASTASSNINSSYYMYFYSNGLFPQNSNYRAYGFSLRCFKNSPLIPNSSWTTIYEGTGGAGIYHDASEGVISISSDGQTWITIADKNLGATTVYNDGDTLSQANCGNYYQWGNNYGFPWTGTISKTSSEQVDASAYGKGNPYSSDTFITNNYWDSSDNRNLWGGVTDLIQKKAEWKDIEALPEGGTSGQVLKKTEDGAAWGDETKELPELGENGQVLTVTGGERDTQGPAPDGYHVPTQAEWEAVYDAGVSLGAWASKGGDDFRIKMKMPIAGYRDYSTSNVGGQGSYGRYWSTTTHIADYSYGLAFYSSSLDSRYTNNRTYCYSVRCFRNFPLKPSSSWTIIYEGSNGAGIYHNSTEGVISISRDGQTWITIADKNLGATTVYNDGDTLSEANCGKYYQRGNNYGFPWTGTVSKTSSTMVDASAYGPGNYYSNDTFIVGIDGWDSSNNRNLWGGVTKLISEKKAEWKDIEALPEGGEVGQVLTRTEEGASWEDVSIKARGINGFWSGTSEEYSEIAHDADTLYFII